MLSTSDRFRLFGKKSPMGGSRSSRPVPMGVVSGPHVSTVVGLRPNAPGRTYLLGASRRPPRSLLRLGLDRRGSRRMVDGARPGPGCASRRSHPICPLTNYRPRRKRL
jgi:hypothetical protein